MRNWRPIQVDSPTPNTELDSVLDTFAKVIHDIEVIASIRSALAPDSALVQQFLQKISPFEVAFDDLLNKSRTGICVEKALLNNMAGRRRIRDLFIQKAKDEAAARITQIITGQPLTIQQSTFSSQ